MHAVRPRWSNELIRAATIFVAAASVPSCVSEPADDSLRGREAQAVASAGEPMTVPQVLFDAVPVAVWCPADVTAGERAIVLRADGAGVALRMQLAEVRDGSVGLPVLPIGGGWTLVVGDRRPLHLELRDGVCSVMQDEGAPRVVEGRVSGCAEAGWAFGCGGAGPYAPAGDCTFRFPVLARTHCTVDAVSLSELLQGFLAPLSPRPVSVDTSSQDALGLAFVGLTYRALGVGLSRLTVVSVGQNDHPLQIGDVIRSVRGVVVNAPAEIGPLLQLDAPETVRVEVDRGGVLVAVEVPVVWYGPPADLADNHSSIH